MPLQFFGVDNEFATSTGSNVDSAPGQSTFDNPPQSSTNLVVTPQNSDSDPRLFEIGDTYDISWNGGSIQNAVVVRSDAAPDSGGVIVLEGVDANGDTAQVIWTPGFDVEQWYTDNYNPDAEPGFYTTDTQPDYDHKFVCFAAETLIRTPRGPIPAGDLCRGDLVCTVDAGAVAIEWATHWHGKGSEGAAPIWFDAQSIGNTRPLRLSQQHRVLVRSPRLQLLFGMDEALAPAKAFANGHSIRVQPCQQICYVHILLPQHHLIEAEGAFCETLFWGDQASKRLVQQATRTNGCSLAFYPMKSARPILKYAEARLVLQTALLDERAVTQPISYLTKGRAA
ncbi:Hint domain-containing protein [uncultured Sulfitobacter sp.]|uniref:Hint domain-containing protein n=1 Tax=uncultured Sulfitobacter sp. TaxID=191468 RepID=UPI002634DB2F|nr:Hint domain-containing protein [uncultured Sulfitobacter sp.]